MLGMQHADNSSDPLLNRPISILDVADEPRQAATELRFLIKEAGRGTKLLSSLNPGDRVLCHGPLGTVFPEPEAGEHVALVGGGVGIAPLWFCAREWAGRSRISLFYGGRNRAELPLLDPLATIPLNHLEAVTEDGSFGQKGLVTEPLADFVASNPVDRLYCCGPNPMMEAVCGLMPDKLDRVWVSLENRMGCGLGACLGCVLPLRSDKKTVMARICKEGPVFKADRVIWDERY